METGASLRPPIATIGNLFGRRQDDPLSDLPVPLTAPARPITSPEGGPIETAAADIGDLTTQESDTWMVRGGVIERRTAAAPLRDGVEVLDYNNPYGQDIERVWFDGAIVYACDLGQVTVDPASVKVAQEYQIVYGVSLDENGLPDPEPEPVLGQYNIYDSVPSMEKYSPIWQFNYVIVPRTYVPNTLRSEADCLASGYPILRSMRFEN